MSEQTKLTSGEVARQLNVTVEQVIEMVYGGRLQATVDRTTGRLLFARGDLRPSSGAEAATARR